MAKEIPPFPPIFSRSVGGLIRAGNRRPLRIASQAPKVPFGVAQARKFTRKRVAEEIGQIEELTRKFLTSQKCVARRKKAPRRSGRILVET